MSYNYKWPRSRDIQQPPQQQGAGSVGHASQHDRLPVGVSWPKTVGSHPISRYTVAGSEAGNLQVSYPSILNAPGSRRGAGMTMMTNPSATAQFHQPSAPPQPLMGMPLYRPVSPPSSPPHAPPYSSYPMEASSNCVSPPPGFPAKQVSRSNKEVPVALRLNRGVPTTSTTTRPREMVSPPPTAMPTLSQVRRSSISPRNRCICQRAYCKVVCSICKQASRGRVRLQCPQHPHTIHLMDYDCCPNCKAVNLTEVELRPN